MRRLSPAMAALAAFVAVLLLADVALAVRLATHPASSVTTTQQQQESRDQGDKGNKANNGNHGSHGHHKPSGSNESDD
ncbi:MAG TPA: hypothetical protein VGT01_08110 [Candidatus Dormibacteraeota bacterium]|nr:hypothetical protein [Candidatus Dormibacteraeota bacterium]